MAMLLMPLCCKRYLQLLSLRSSWSIAHFQLLAFFLAVYGRIFIEEFEAQMTEKMTPTMNRMQDQINQMQDQMNRMQDRMNQMQYRINTLESKYENGGSSLFSDTSNERIQNMRMSNKHMHVNVASSFA